MFYEPKDGHSLPHNPFNALIAPRPIGWISTRSADGIDNLAPYSFFNAVAYEPPQVMFASTSAKVDQNGTKDSVANIRDTGAFAVNLATFDLRDAMNQTSGGWDKSQDEFDLAGLAKVPCKTISCARVSASPATLECTLTQIIELPGQANLAVFGTVTGIHINDAHLKDGLFDPVGAEIIARMGYRDYTRVTDSFTLERP